MNLVGVDGIGYRVSSGGAGGTIELHAGSVDGPLVQTVAVANTGGWDNYVELPATPVANPGGTAPLYLVFKGTGGGGLFDVDYIKATGPGVVGGGEPSCTPAQPEAGYRMLFDGTAASLGNWRQSGPGGFTHQSDCTILSHGGLGLLSFNEEFNAYSLKLDWKVAGDDNSGVFVGYPDPGNDPWVAVNQGYEVQIDATDAPDKTTGAIYSFQSADIAKRDAALKPPGQWNSYEIVVVGQTIKVFLNGVLINDFVSTDPNRDLTQGFVGVQNHGDGDDVSFRNVQIKEIADTAAPVTTATFASPGASGWHPGTVPVDLSAADEGQGVERIEWRLDNGAWTPYTGTITVTGDGTHTLLYRAVDRVGNVESDKAATIKIDGTKPTLMVAGVANGRVYGDATDLVLSWHAEDATSGVQSVTGALDGRTIPSGLVPLYQLPLGTHGLTVTATDVAGNVTSSSLSFASTTSLRDIGQLLDRFRATNRLSLSAYNALTKQLTKARRAEANGDDELALRELQRFVGLATDASRVRDGEVRSVLERDAQAVIDTIEGVAMLPEASR